ncbi:hypothetical protein [Streptomyces sp. NBC_01794]|uniref:hypothetical protein n=1 Tax=Streptomyces sp. NBC_01794 TaxID=2975942 RepID=UPI003873A009
MDAELNLNAGDLAASAILAGRGGVDAQVHSYLAVLEADSEKITARQAMDLFIGTELAVSPSDVALVQGALTRSTGPCYTVLRVAQRANTSIGPMGKPAAVVRSPHAAL